MYTMKERNLWCHKGIDKSEILAIYINKSFCTDSQNIDCEWCPTTEESPIRAIVTKKHILHISLNGENYIYANPDSSYMFSDFENVKIIDGLNKLNTEKVTNMSHMFDGTGKKVIDKFTIKGLSNWRVSNVRNMSYMFYSSGLIADEYTIKGLENWDTQKVTNMQGMFFDSGRNADIWTIGDISKWNVSSVRIMNAMFSNAGKRADQWDIGDISNWDVSNVIDMSYMFANAGKFAEIFKIGNISYWDVSNVTDMSGMFDGTGSNDNNLYVDLRNWNVKKVSKYMSFANTDKIALILPKWRKENT